MVGRYKIRIKNSRNSYEFELKRNITILCGDSGRGKTTLFDMISEYNRFGKNSGVSISCDRPIYALRGGSWREELEKKDDSIIVIDEDSHFIKTEEFASALKGNSNYFLLITRNYLPQLPYSVDEIYEISGNKNKRFKAVYHEAERIFDDPDKNSLPFVPDIIITEDGRSGFKFFSAAAKMGIVCVAANGKSNIIDVLREYRDKRVVIVADGAAFGPEIRALAEQQKLSYGKLAIFLPESFEWLILSAGVVEIKRMEMLVNPEEYAESRRYLSWEQYFTELLINETKGNTVTKYSKSRLKPYYLQAGNVQKVKSLIKGIDF